jgi:hypothetical protein
MIRKMNLFYVVGRSGRDDVDLPYIDGPFRTWDDAREAKNRMQDSHLLGIAQQVVHVEVD